MRSIHYAVNLTLIEDGKPQIKQSWMGFMNVSDDTSKEMMFTKAVLDTASSSLDNIIVERSDDL